MLRRLMVIPVIDRVLLLMGHSILLESSYLILQFHHGTKPLQNGERGTGTEKGMQSTQVSAILKK